jgi:hypothetical protein
MNARRPDTEQNLPLVTIDVPEKGAGELKGLKPGDVVRVVLVGTVVEVAQRDPEISIPAYTGTLKLEVKSTNVNKQDGAFADMADDD